MAKYKLTNKAVDDLTRIWNYTFDKWPENQADKYYATLIDSFEQVANNFDLGKSYSGVTENLLGFNFQAYRQLASKQICRLESSVDGIEYFKTINLLRG